MAESISLMSKRIRRILLICNTYDGFLLEEDGRIETQTRQEYLELNLSNPPEFIRAETTYDALKLLAGGEKYDLILTMYNVGDISVFDFAPKAKVYCPDVPIVLLTSYSREIYRKIQDQAEHGIDYYFCWDGSAELIIAIIKLIEDSLNAEHDILECGVQAILLVEDNMRYCSTYLPALYRIILQQNKESSQDTLNEQEKILRKRSRPKIFMATNLDDAVSMYRKYKDNYLGIISDVGFVIHKGDRSSEEKIDAGVDFCKIVKQDTPKMAFLMQSSQQSMKAVADSLGVGFLRKSSSMLHQELGEYLEREFGFGDFVIFDSGQEIARARDLLEFENVLKSIPVDVFIRLTANNYLSKWLYARGLFKVGKKISAIRSVDFDDDEKHRSTVVSIIHDFRISQAQGVVAAFNSSAFNDAIWFSRVGSGSLGGKARGLAFLNHILQKYNLYDKWEGVRVMVPRTLVITTEYYDRFIQENGLKYVINSEPDDNELLSEFVSSALPRDLLEDLRTFVRVARKPLAVRSSSKLEDSYHQPFAGVYSTYMIPYVENIDQRLRMLSKAITSVYASAYFSSSRSYITASGNVISEEKMAIVVQEVCGSEDKGYYFPTLSGVARSINFYPIGYEKPEDGMVKLAFGLGKAVVDGEKVLRFSPKYPKHVLQTSTTDLAIKETQNVMYALNMRPEKFKTSVNDAVNLERLNIVDCQQFRSLKHVVSTWDSTDMRMVDSAFPKGPKFVTFSQMLKYNTFPVADIVNNLLQIVKSEMKTDVEIEFAANIQDEDTAVFSVLQARPISVDSRFADVNWDELDCSNAFLTSNNALGTGWVEGVRDIVYLKESGWDVLKTQEIARQVRAVNTRMLNEKKGYVLIGFGRWGTRLDSLGVPVAWGDISEARVIVECALPDFQVDPSQGTHFFQNLTSFNVGYINVNTYANRDDVMDFTKLDELEAVEETEFLRHVRLSEDVMICIDGKKNRAVLKF